MIIRIFGHLSPREPLLFLLWMMLTITTSELRAIRSSTEPRPTNSKSSSKPDEIKPRISNLPMQNDFPYRYVFPANHPFSAFTQYITHPTPSPQGGQNAYDSYASASTSQHYHAPEFKYVLKSPSPFHQSSQYALPHIPLHPTPAPQVILLLQSQPGSSPYQTFVLVPADSTRHLGGLTVSSSGLPTIGLAAAGIPVRPNILPITATIPTSMLTHSSQFIKPSPHYQSHQLGAPIPTVMQRHIGMYSVSSGKLFPQKKSSIEPKNGGGSEDNEKSESRRVTTSTEKPTEKLNIGALRSRS